MEHGFNWLSLIPAFHDHHTLEMYGPVFMSLVVFVLVLIGAIIARVQLSAAIKREDEGLIPDSKLTFRNFFEIIAEKIYGLSQNVMGNDNTRKYFPLIGSLFIFIFTANFLGLIPGLLPPTDNLNTTFALGVFVFIFYTFTGFREHGIAYLKQFVGPLWWLAPLMIVVEIASHVFRPISLGLRLRGNIMGDHVVLGIFNDLTPYVVPAIFYGVGLFVALVQAFVFCLMTMVYISLSTSHDH